MRRSPTTTPRASISRAGASASKGRSASRGLPDRAGVRRQPPVARCLRELSRPRSRRAPGRTVQAALRSRREHEFHESRLRLPLQGREALPRPRPGSDGPRTGWRGAVRGWRVHPGRRQRPRRRRCRGRPAAGPPPAGCSCNRFVRPRPCSKTFRPASPLPRATSRAASRIFAGPTRCASRSSGRSLRCRAGGGGSASRCDGAPVPSWCNPSSFA